MTRIIHFIDPSTGREFIHITEDLDTDVNDFIPPNHKLESATILAGKLPASFPTDSTFEKE